MSIFFLPFGMIFAFAGMVLLWDYYTMITTYEVLPGAIKGFRTRYKRTGSSSSFMYYPVIEYIAYGNMKEFQANSGASWPMYDIGESVEVYYSKEYDDGRLKSVSQAVIGSIFLIIGLVVCYIFWTYFEMSLFTQLSAVGISAVMAWVFGMLLRKKDIKSVPEFTQQMRHLRKKVRHKNDSDDNNLITKRSELLSTDLPGNKNLKIVGPVFGLIGLIAIGAAIYFGINRWNFLERAESTEGIVTDYRASTDDDGTTYYPIVEFKSPYSNNIFTFQHDVGSSTPSYSKGAMVSVLFDPNNEQDAIIDEGIWNWFGPILISVLGLSFFFVGSMLTRRWFKIKRYKQKALSY